MPKDILRKKAIELRSNGLSYSEILDEVDVAKSTLSLWLRSVGLSKPQKQRLTQKKIASMRRGADAKREQRIVKSNAIKKLARAEASRLIHDPFWLTGTVLYWSEGAKEKEWRVSEKTCFTNMDVDSLRIFVLWAKKYLQLENDRFIYDIYIHEKADINKAKEFWADRLHISQAELRIYLKKHNLNPKRKNIFAEYNGVCRITISRGTDINRKIAGWIEGVIEYLH